MKDFHTSSVPLPLTLTLSPKGRGDLVALHLKGRALTQSLPRMHDIACVANFPLRLGERVRVRGKMQQTDLATARARNLRQHQTDAERILWYHLRDRRFMALKFRRQVPLGPFIADFYCAEHRLITEADGGHHGGPSDLRRDAWLTANGISTLRFWNHDILFNLPGTLDRIAQKVSP